MASNPPVVKQNVIVVGIDFGTTYSGVSWVRKTDPRNAIALVRKWPHEEGNAANDKVPSVIDYDRNGKVLNWGYKVHSVDNERGYRFEWMKLLFANHQHYSEASHDLRQRKVRALGLLRSLPKSTTMDHVVRDYLAELWKHAIAEIEECKTRDWTKGYEIRPVLTMPYMWDDSSRQRTKDIAKAAKIPMEHGLTITEPHAAALWILERDAADFELGDSFVVCDAGGGTVDLISYEIIAQNPLRLAECVAPKGELHGSVFLNMSFRRYLEEEVLGRDQWHKLKNWPIDDDEDEDSDNESDDNSQSDNAQPRTVDQTKRALDDFEIRLKRRFCTLSRKPWTSELWYVEANPALGNIRASERAKIKTNLIVHTQVRLEKLFSETVSKIELLVKQQIWACKKAKKNPKAVMLVGGFGDSNFLHQRLEACIATENLEKGVLRHTDGWSAVVRGAALFGMDTDSPTVQQTKARTNFGVSLNVVWDDAIHKEVTDKYVDKFGTTRAKGQMEWLMLEGEDLVYNRVLATPVFNSVDLASRKGEGSWKSVSNLFGLPGDFLGEDTQPPRRKADCVARLKRQCQVTWSLTNEEVRACPKKKAKDNKEEYAIVNYKIEIFLGNACMEFRVRFNGKIYGNVDVTYEQET